MVLFYLLTINFYYVELFISIINLKPILITYLDSVSITHKLLLNATVTPSGPMTQNRQTFSISQSRISVTTKVINIMCHLIWKWASWLLMVPANDRLAHRGESYTYSFVLVGILTSRELRSGYIWVSYIIIMLLHIHSIQMQPKTIEPAELEPAVLPRTSNILTIQTTPWSKWRWL